MDYLMKNKSIYKLLYFLLFIVYSCNNIKQDTETLKVEYWIRNFSSNSFPKLYVDMVPENEVHLNGLDISAVDLQKISELQLNRELFSYSDYFGYYIARTKVDVLDTSIVVSRFLLSNNKELNGAIDLFYTNDYGIVMKKYHGKNYEILDRIIWVKERKELYSRSMNDLIQGIFDNEIINPPNMRY